jgi:type I restriction enzyme S subunit
MEGWSEKKIREFADVKGGKRLPKGKQLAGFPTAHPYIRIRDLGKSKILQLNSEYEYVDDETQKEISRYIVAEGDILISVVGTIGLIGIVGNSLDGANQTENCDKITNLEGVDRDYLYYYLISPIGQGEIKKETVGAVQPKLPLKNIQDLPVRFPPLQVQKRIASVLSSLDDKIEENERINKNLQAQAQAIYTHMMTDEADESWSNGLLSDIAIITMGQSPKGDTYNENSSGTVFFQGRAEFGFRFPTRRLYTTDPRRMAQANDVLMSVRAPVGDLNVAYEDCCIGRGLAAIHSKDKHQSFVLYTMFALRDQLDVFNGEGTVFGSINRDALNSMPISIPPREIVDNFEGIVSPMDAEIRNNYEENCRLQTMRDSLLPRLMSGELDVSDIDL